MAMPFLISETRKATEFSLGANIKIAVSNQGVRYKLESESTVFMPYGIPRTLGSQRKGHQWSVSRL